VAHDNESKKDDDIHDQEVEDVALCIRQSFENDHDSVEPWGQIFEYFYENQDKVYWANALVVIEVVNQYEKLLVVIYILESFLFEPRKSLPVHQVELDPEANTGER